VTSRTNRAVARTWTSCRPPGAEQASRAPAARRAPRRRRQTAAKRLTGPDALTTAEQRVATLAAQGRSNREIAELLHVSQRTVETHLTHAFQNLHIVNRTQLAADRPSGGRSDAAPSLST